MVDIIETLIETLKNIFSSKQFLYIALFVIVGNYGIHLYFKYKRKLLFKKIDNKKFELIKNIRAEIISTSSLSYSWQYFMSDIILYDDKLFVLLSNYGLKGLINQNQSTIQISKNKNSGKFDGVDNIYLMDKSEFIGSKINIYSIREDLLMKANFKIVLNFKVRFQDLKTVTDFINENLN